MSLWGAIGAGAGFLLGGPAGAAVGATIGGSLDQSNAVGAAANTAANATNNAVGEQRRQYDTTRADYAPWRAAGQQALGQLQTDINGAPTAAEVMAQPGYQFGLQQGQLGLDRKAAAAGGRVSGAALKAASSYATDYATTGYNAEYQRRQDRLNRLAALAGIGQTATGGTAAAGANSTNAISGLINGAGQTQAGAQLAQGNIWASAGNQLAAAAGRFGADTGVGSVPGGYDLNGLRYNNPSAYTPG